MDLIEPYDIVIDGTDNFPTRYCVNDAAVLMKKINVYGSIFRFDGMVTVFAPHLKHAERDEPGPCYRCLYPEPPDPGSVPSCAEGGVMGVLPGVIGTLQAAEVIKLITGIGKPAIGKLIRYDALDLTFQTLKLRRDPACPVCGNKPTIFEPIDYEQFCGMPILDRNSVEETRSEVNKALADMGLGPLETASLDDRGLPRGYAFRSDVEITPRELKQHLDAGQKPILVDCRTPNEREIVKLDDQAFVPLEQISNRIDELKQHAGKPIVAYCRIGTRSIQFAQILRQHGLDARSLAGGILLWNTDIDRGGIVY
jgi:adenylyltransferase/sulfurtransferase